MCSHCGMPVGDGPRYHPYAACLMMRASLNGDTVKSNLRAVVEYGMNAEKAGVSLDTAMSDFRAALTPTTESGE